MLYTAFRREHHFYTNFYLWKRRLRNPILPLQKFLVLSTDCKHFYVEWWKIAESPRICFPELINSRPLLGITPVFVLLLPIKSISEWRIKGKVRKAEHICCVPGVSCYEHPAQAEVPAVSAFHSLTKNLRRNKWFFAWITITKQHFVYFLSQSKYRKWTVLYVKNNNYKQRQQ